MRQLLRALDRWEVPRIAAGGLGAACLVVLAAYVVAGVTGQFTPGAALSALALLAIAATGILYAWRPGSGRLD